MRHKTVARKFVAVLYVITQEDPTVKPVRQRDSEANLSQPGFGKYLDQAAGRKVSANGKVQHPTVMSETTEMYFTENETSPGPDEEIDWAGCPIDVTVVTIDSITLLLCLFGLVGNGIVLWFLSFCIKRNVFTVYILNLAAADFGFLIFLPGFLITSNAEQHFCVASWGPTLKNTFLVLSLLMYSTSLYFLTAISMERCVSVFFPIWHRRSRPTHLSAIICALLWTLSCLLSGIVYSLCLVDGTEYCLYRFLPVYGLNCLIFAPIMVVSSLVLFIKLRRSLQFRHPGKLYVVILLTVFFFLVFAVPLSVQYFLDLIEHSLTNEFSYLLASINSCINPVIYFVVGSYRQYRLRGCLLVALRAIFEEKTDFSEDGEISRQDTMRTAI
nr:mas-related G-protein coupled receptor member H-like [Pelodiscus sinensis]|eukprot:XP_025037393.1 mas-related G-protein coupled receptor member H-like [Pelodiscus sinensis]